MSSIRVIYFGTPDYAVPTLELLVADDRFDVALVVTQPDRPAGRGRRLQEPAVKRAAADAGLPIYQPESLRSAEARMPLEQVKADLFIVAAYGLIFGRTTLAIPPLGCLNLHASLLPKYRGASPIPAAILEGDEATGVTLMKMETGLDTGPIIDSAIVDVESTETTGSLTDRLAMAAAKLARDAIPDYVSGKLAPTRQPALGESVTRLLTKADGRLDWRESARSNERRVRAMMPWPKAWTTASERTLQVHAAHVVERPGGSIPGQVAISRNELIVACGAGALALDVVQPAGGKAMAGSAFATGRGIQSGDLLGAIADEPERRLPLVRLIDGDPTRSAG